MSGCLPDMRCEENVTSSIGSCCEQNSVKELEALGKPSDSADLEPVVVKETVSRGDTRTGILTLKFRHLLPLGTRWQENSGSRMGEGLT